MEGIDRVCIAGDMTEFLDRGNDYNSLSGYPFSGQTHDPGTSQITSRNLLCNPTHALFTL
jgi:hypothetical protein